MDCIRCALLIGVVTTYVIKRFYPFFEALLLGIAIVYQVIYHSPVDAKPLLSESRIQCPIDAAPELIPS